MNEKQYLLCFLGLAVVLLMLVSHYPPVFRMKSKFRENMTNRKKKKTRKVKFRNPVVSQVRQITPPNSLTTEHMTNPQHTRQPLNIPEQLPTYQDMSQQMPQQMPQQMSQQMPQQMPQQPQMMPQQMSSGPPPPIETNPRKEEQPTMYPQGMATQENELERFTLQSSALSGHTESMSGDNFFSSGGLSPANGSEFGSPF